MPRPEFEKDLERLQFMMQQHLQSRAVLAPPMIAGRHLDEDMLSVFVEGRLSEKENSPLVSHLVACASCRHTTVQLIRLADTLEPEMPPLAQPAPAVESGLFRRFFEGLRARVMSVGSETEAVFAYHDTETPDETVDVDVTQSEKTN
jgi:hypothetical protein